jgi:ribosomal protein S18 acetylase RimI-like enzyme
MFEFKPIDLEQHAPWCIRFRGDSLFCSFGSTDLFYEGEEEGSERYLAWLRQRMEIIPNSCVHLWEDEQIIGQIEMKKSYDDPRVGYINLFYLIPEYRGRGLGNLLDEYAANFFKQLGCTAARLSVTQTNLRAMKFYSKQGWQDVGPRDGNPGVHYMEKQYLTHH